FEDANILLVPTGNFRNGRLAGDLLGVPRDERLPKVGPTHRESDETRHAGGNLEPLVYVFIILAAAEYDAAHLVAPAAPGRGHNRGAVFAAVKSLDFPDVRLDARVLELFDRLNHELRAK